MSSLVLVLLLVMVRLHDLLAQFLFPLVNVSVELVSILSDREFLVVIDWDVDLPVAHGLVVRVVELSNIGVSQRLLGGQAFGGIELQKVPQHIQRIIWCSWEHISQTLGLGGWQRLQHGGSQRTVDCLHIFNRRPSGNFHHPIQLVERRGAGENWLAKQELSKDTAQTPHVHTLSVVVGPQQDFWGAVPTSGHIVRQ